MNNKSRDFLRPALAASLIAVFGCFLASLFLNIGYPLFWNDEGMTVMHGKRVLEYGYPKVWDGKNKVYDLLHPDKELGIDKKTDAFIGGSGWGHYYFAAPFLAIAEGISDDHVRTGFVRFWFALSGLLGLIVLGVTLGRVWEKPRQKLAAALIFAVTALFSVPLTLHLRDARYYALCVLLAALIAAAYSRKRLMPEAADLHKAKGLVRYNLYLTFLMVAMMFTFAPGFIAMGGAIGLAEMMRMLSLSFVKAENGESRFSTAALWRSFLQILRANLFLIISGLLFIPFLIFFKTFEINRLLQESNARINYYTHYGDNLSAIIDYFRKFEPFVAFVVMRVFVLILTPSLLQRRDKRINRQLRLSGFLSLCFAFTIAMGARVPNEMFIRYFVPAIPLMFAVLALDAMSIWNWLCPMRRLWHWTFAVCSLGLWSLPLPHNLPYLRGHVHEMFHSYKGHLDYIIPFIRMRYPDTSKLVIAANYEESCFMYYLDSKVTIGYVQANIENDIRFQPDVIYFNSLWNWGQDYRILDHFLATGKYGRAQFPVALYRVNNIPEVHVEIEIEHQFYALEPKPGEPQEELLIKIK